MNTLSTHHQRCSYFGTVIDHDFFKTHTDLSQEWWDTLCHYGSLTEDFVREFVNDINWKSFNEYIVLEGTMIREFKDYINLNNYFRFGRIPKEMIRELKNDINWDKLKTAYLKHLKEDIKEEFLDENFMYK